MSCYILLLRPLIFFFFKKEGRKNIYIYNTSLYLAKVPFQEKCFYTHPRLYSARSQPHSTSSSASFFLFSPSSLLLPLFFQKKRSEGGIFTAFQAITTIPTSISKKRKKKYKFKALSLSSSA